MKVHRLLVIVVAAIAALVIGASDTYAAGVEVDLEDSGGAVNPGMIIYGRDEEPLYSGALAAWHGFALGHGDFNGDGVEDMLVTAPLADGVGEARNASGEAYVVLGSDSLEAEIDTFYGEQSFTIYGADAVDRLGYEFATLSHHANVNGDEYDDIIVAAPSADGPGNNRSNAGEVYVILGSAQLGYEDGIAGGCGNGVNDNPAQDSNADDEDDDCFLDLSEEAPDLTIYGQDAADNLGTATVMRDLNGDGLSDIAVGAAGADGEGESKSASGEVYVIFGDEDLGASGPEEIDLDSESADVTIFGGDAGDNFGRTVEIRNVNGNGVNSDAFHDLIVGAPGGDGEEGDRANSGEVHMFAGRGTWPSTIDVADSEQTFSFYGEQSGDAFGQTVYSGDVNGDWVNDVLVGSISAENPVHETTGGGAYLFYGGTQLTGAGSADAVDADLRIYGADDDRANGSPAVHTGALTDDHYDEIVIGFNGSIVDSDVAGRTYIIRGGSDLSGVLDLTDADDYDYVIVGDRPSESSAGDYLGWWTAAADVNGNGLSELIVSAFLGDGPDDERDNAGDVYVLFDADLDGLFDSDDPDDDGDGVLDTVDNCPLIPNASQANNYGGSDGDACEDTDGDGSGRTDGPIRPLFSDASETAMGTDPTDACPDDSSHNAWPPDMNNDGYVTNSDVTNWLFRLPSDARTDLDGDGVKKEIPDDVLILISFIGESC